MSTPTYSVAPTEVGLTAASVGAVMLVVGLAVGGWYGLVLAWLGGMILLPAGLLGALVL